MNDDLERLFQPSTPPPPAGRRDPRFQFGPRVQGGPLLDGAPKLDEVRPAQEPPKPPGRVRILDGPHLAPPARPSVPPPPAPAPDARSNGQAAGVAGSRIEQQLVAMRLRKTYRKAAHEIPVLRGVDLAVRRGEFLAVVGQSGSGKSTLLHLLGTLDAPDDGEIHFEGRRIDDLPLRTRDLLRNRQFGMIFQFYHLLPELSTLENVLAPLMIGQGAWAYFRGRRGHKAAAVRLLEMVGLGHRLKHKPRELSGGEMQRAAIARALIAAPSLLLADEPTGNLDQDTGREIMEILRRLNQQEKLTIVMVTHDQTIAQQADRVIRLVDGQVEEAAS